MNMRDAVAKEKACGEWYDGETTVIVWFNHKDQTSLDVTGDDDLVALWESLCEELGSTIDGVDDVFSLGYIDNLVIGGRGAVMRKAERMPFDHGFQTPNGWKVLHATGYEVMFDDDPDIWWGEYEDEGTKYFGC